ncbi:MAG: putative quinol monooxygenase [Acidimicrobiia bacterium]
MASSKLVVRADFGMAETDEDVEAIVAATVAAVEEEEPGTLVYAWYRHVDDPSRWTVLEVYEDEAAQLLHLRGPRVRAASRRLGELIDFANGTATRMLAVAGKGVQ